MIELEREFFGMLRLAKVFHDSPFWEVFHEECDYLPLDHDMSFEMAYITIPLVFEYTNEIYREDYEYSVWIFCDPCIDRFCRFCQEYESRKGLSEENNPYRGEVQQIIRQGFQVDGYSYDFTWRLSAKDHGRKRLVFFAGPEFYYLNELPEGLLEIREGFEALNQRLEAELYGTEKTLRLPAAAVETERKEAA